MIDRGFVFVKTIKAASTTAAGVHIRLSQHAAAANWSHCRMRLDHVQAPNEFQPNINTFAWSVVREPQACILSQAVYTATRYNTTVDVANILEHAPRGHYWHIWMEEECHVPL